MLNDRGEQPENSHDDEAGTENQRAMRKIEPRMQTCPLEVGVDLSDTEPKLDQRESGPDPRHQRTFCRLAIAFPRELVGKVVGKLLVAHRLFPWLARRTTSSSPILAQYFDY